MEWLWNFVEKDKMQWDEAQWLHHEAKNTENKDSHELKKNIKLQLLSSQLIELWHLNIGAYGQLINKKSSAASRVRSHSLFMWLVAN